MRFKADGAHRRRTFAIGVVVALVLGSGVLATPLRASAQVSTDWSGCLNYIGGAGACQIAAKSDLKLCMAVSAVKSGATVELEPCSGPLTNQLWSIITPGYVCDGVTFGFDDVIILVENGVPCTFKPLCLTPTSPGTSGVRMLLLTCTSNNALQEWLVNDPNVSQLRNIAHGDELDAFFSTDKQAGGEIGLWTSNDGSNQQWTPPALP